MEHREHEAIARWERRWLSVAGLVSLVFVILITYTLATEGAHIAQRSSRAEPAQLADLELFAAPGVTALGPGRYRVSIIAQAFTFSPSEIRVPVGAEVDFYLTSRDVLHGFQIQDTAVNVEAIPGEIAHFRYTFDQLGEYRISCNEYCGISHQNMLGRVLVVPASQVAAPAVAAQQSPGQALFEGNCASCHQAAGQGVAGAFPPLAGHTADLIRAERDYLVNVLLYGLRGPIEVAGERYDGVMPAWEELGDEELANLLNYLSEAWGNQAALPEGFVPYEPGEIADARGRDLSPDDVHTQREQLGLD